jgi:outer membrane protein assembly factor BamA
VSSAYADDLDGAPPPGDESGRVDQIDDGDSTARVVGRSVLLVPRAAFELAVSPVRAGLWTYERYQIGDLWRATFFTKSMNVGVYPVLLYDTGYGFNYGARFVAHDVLGEAENFTLRAATGSSYSISLRGALNSGLRFDPLQIELGAEYEERKKDRFYGIGNADTISTPTMPLDPIDNATETRYGQDHVRATLVFDYRFAQYLHGRASGSIMHAEFGEPSKGQPTDRIYMVEQLTGWPETNSGYAELELAYDSRRNASRWEVSPLASKGWRAAVYGGYNIVEQGDDFWRVGGEAQYLLRLTEGPRVLAARVYAETVSGDVEDIAFDLLPKLGGPNTLRGYNTDRFRDKAAALGSLEYRWDVYKFVLAHIFVDAGRVARSFGDLTDDGDLRVGYGIGIQAFSERNFLFRISIASSVDGGAFLNFSFDPTFYMNTRVKRR